MEPMLFRALLKRFHCGSGSLLRRSRRRPQLEVLEDRLAPATVTWVGSTLNIDGNTSELLVGRTLINQGLATWSNTNDVYLQDGAVFLNAQGATFVVKNSHTLFNNGGASPSFTNVGTFIKMASDG